MRKAALFLIALAGCSGCQSRPAKESPLCTLVSEGPGPPGEIPVRAEEVVSGLEVPWGLAFLPDGDLLVTERPGRLRRVSGGALVAEPVATIPVAATGEGGLLGIALHPGFAQNRQLYLYVTAADGGRVTNRVERWVLSPDKATASLDRVVLEGIPGAAVHDGGRLRFGPDGMLYVGTGDAREPDSAQRPDSLSGKLLRVTPEGEPPADNPRPESPVFLAGLRNPQGFDWLDERNLAVADHGPSGDLGRTGHDELNVARGGDNLGWPTVFGCQEREGLVAPRLTWREAVPPGGAAVYRGDLIPAWTGSVVIGTLGSRHLHRVVLGAAEPHRLLRHEVYFAGDPPDGLGRIREVANGPDGALYLTTSNCDGRGRCPATKDSIFKILPAP